MNDFTGTTLDAGDQTHSHTGDIILFLVSATIVISIAIFIAIEPTGLKITSLGAFGFAAVALLTAPLGWKLGSILRRLAHPEMIFVSGKNQGEVFVNMLGAKLFWKVGPQSIGWIIGVVAAASLFVEHSPRSVAAGSAGRAIASEQHHATESDILAGLPLATPDVAQETGSSLPFANISNLAIDAGTDLPANARDFQLTTDTRTTATVTKTPIQADESRAERTADEERRREAAIEAASIEAGRREAERLDRERRRDKADIAAASRASVGTAAMIRNYVAMEDCEHADEEITRLLALDPRAVAEDLLWEVAHGALSCDECRRRLLKSIITRFPDAPRTRFARMEIEESLDA